MICTFNNAILLGQTLSALEKQQVVGAFTWSVLVVDNNSQDDTPQVVQAYARRGIISHLRYLREDRQGVGFARLRAIQETGAELIAFVDDDCLLDPDWLEQAVRFCHTHPQAGAIGSRVQLLWEDTPTAVSLQHADSLAHQDFGDVPQHLTSVLPVGAGLVVRRSAVLASGWLDQMKLVGRCGGTLSAGEDSELVLRVRNAGFELWYNPEMQLGHYIPKRRMSVDYLCRLHRGFGRSFPVLALLTNDQRSDLGRRLYVLRGCLSVVILLLFRIVWLDLLPNRRITPNSKIAFYEALGRTEATFEVLVRPFQV